MHVHYGQSIQLRPCSTQEKYHNIVVVHLNGGRETYKLDPEPLHNLIWRAPNLAWTPLYHGLAL
jgi:hypothetical protein